MQGQESSSSATSSTSRPPRAPGAPVGVKAPYQPLAQLSASAARSGTPPRRAADPGAKTDANFVYEDWDDEDSNNVSNSNNKSLGPGRKAEEKPGFNNTSLNSAGMKVDANWLQEDFDDD